MEIYNNFVIYYFSLQVFYTCLIMFYGELDTGSSRVIMLLITETLSQKMNEY